MLVSGFGPPWKLLPGEVIPDFSLRTATGPRVRPSQLSGARLVLAFTGLAGDRSTRILLSRLVAAYPVLAQDGVAVLAIAPVQAETGFAAEPPIALPFPILRDAASAVHRRFGAVDWTGQPAASLFITDPRKRVIYRALAGLGESLPTAEDIVNLIHLDQIAWIWHAAPLR